MHSTSATLTPEKTPFRILPVLVFSQFAGGSLWFAGNAVIHALGEDLKFPAESISSLTSAVQIGFMVGTLCFAFLNLSDRFKPSRVFFMSSLLGAAANLAIVFLAENLTTLLILRFITGASLAGVYPVGMKIAASWYRTGLGAALGYLVGALVFGKSFSFMLRGIGQDWSWQTVLIILSVLALSGGTLLLTLVPEGPYLKSGVRFDPRALKVIFSSKLFRSSAFGYFGHMWELYAFWTFVPTALAYYQSQHPDVKWNASVWTSLVIGLGGLSCIVGGYLSKRIGSAPVASIQLAASALFCGLSPWLLNVGSPTLFLGILILWGIVVVGDSPQFSALNAKTAPPDFVGSALTIVTCVGFLITVPSIALVGWIAEAYSPEWMFLCLTPGPLLGWMSLRLAKKNERRELTSSS